METGGGIGILDSAQFQAVSYRNVIGESLIRDKMRLSLGNYVLHVTSIAKGVSVFTKTRNA